MSASASVVQNSTSTQKAKALFVTPDTHQRLKIIAATLGLPIQAVVEEAASDWLAKKGKEMQA